MKLSNYSLYFFTFLVGATTYLDVNLIARVPAAELLAFSSIPFLLSNIGISRYYRRLVPIIFLFMIWALGVLASDIFNRSVFELFIRGFMKPFFCFFWMLFFIGIIIRDTHSLVWFVVGTLIAALQNYVAPASHVIEYVADEGYQHITFVIGPILVALTVLSSMFFYSRNRISSGCMFFICAGIFLIIGMPRSTVAIALLTGLSIIYICLRHIRSGIRPISWPNMIFITAIISCSLLVIFYTYTYTASIGLLGEYQYKKYIDQSNTVFGASPLGVILDGRAFSFAALLAALDRPLLGHGSWSGQLMQEYYLMAVSMVGTDSRELNNLLSGLTTGRAGHSVLFAAWMENGILAAVSLITFLCISIRQFMHIIIYDHLYAPWFIWLLLNFYWAFWFSPFQTATRLVVGLFLALHILQFFERSVNFKRTRMV